MQINLLDNEGWIERRWPPERPGFRWRRKRVAGEQLGASLYGGSGEDARRWFFLDDAVGYWDGEAPE